MRKRSFEELSVVATGVQSFQGRFGKRRRFEYDDVPPISQWRCNLTALSQEHNLYFVAYGRDIHVYVPQFPTQSIAPEPVLIVPSQPSSGGLRGYLDPREPHSINNLVIQCLGNDEVVATVRDDGDVDAVLVRHIVQAIHRRAEPDSTIGVVADEIKPIFQSNVGVSAWGLAIHSEARILATSSNAHEVRVFKFGLLHEDEETAEAGREQTHRSPAITTNGASGEHRTMDVTQRVLNGNANIPYISFCNTGDDPTARWLLTTDISGYCRVMDLHSMQGADVTVQQFRFGRSFLGQGGGFDRLNAGWCLMFLDTRSFQPERSFQAAVGLADGGSLPGIRGNNTIWDLSDTVDLVAENSAAFVPRKRQNATPASTRTRRSVSAGVSDVDASLDDDTESVPDSSVAETEAATHQHASETLMQDQMEVRAFGQLDEIALELPSPRSQEDELENDLEDDSIALINDDDPEDEGTEDSTPFTALYGGKRIFGNQPYFYHQTGLCDDLPCPILHASVKNIYLLQPSNQKYSSGAFSPPMVGLANPVRQAVHSHFGYLNMFDRLNMNAYIPTLGVIVLASQKGRAVVLSLSKLSASARYPADMRDQQGKKTKYAMRVECVLPFEHQEAQNQRPFAPLHGIATSPVQGAHRNRWRLMMMYQDHSTLSYEIAGPRSARDSAVDVASLVV